MARRGAITRTVIRLVSSELSSRAERSEVEGPRRNALDSATGSLDFARDEGVTTFTDDFTGAGEGGLRCDESHDGTASDEVAAAAFAEYLARHRSVLRVPWRDDSNCREC